MTEFKDAKRIAAGYLKDIDHCVEYKNAFVFTNSRSSKGLGDQPVAVLKKTGEAMDFERYLREYGRVSLREFDC